VHEGSITAQIVETVLSEATQRKATRVNEVYLEIGALSFLNPEQVRFWYEILTRDTLLDGSKLVIQHRKGTVKCPKCGYNGELTYMDDAKFHVPVPTLQCPQCEGLVEIVSGKDCVVRTIKMVA
jgi:hydrogenase nickel incorporation protein HypA/HybF